MLKSLTAVSMLLAATLAAARSPPRPPRRSRTSRRPASSAPPSISGNGGAGAKGRRRHAAGRQRRSFARTGKVAQRAGGVRDLRGRRQGIRGGVTGCVGTWASSRSSRLRAQAIEFTAPYVIIEGTYMVHKDSSLKQVADVDKPGIRIAVGLGSAYDLYLTRNIKNGHHRPRQCRRRQGDDRDVAQGQARSRCRRAQRA